MSIEPEQYLEKISHDYLRSAQRVLKALNGSLDLISMTYSVAPERQFILEYLQNAIDADATTFHIMILKDRIVIANDGEPFTEDDVDALCNIAQSKKRPELGLIGFIGIGAKSAFLLGNRLEVHSGKYHFAFDRDEWKEIRDNTPWQIMPVPIEKCYKEKCKYTDKHYRTFFIIEKFTRPDVPNNVLKVLFDPSHRFYIDSRVLLFTHLKGSNEPFKIIIKDSIYNYKREISREEEVEDLGSIKVKRVLIKERVVRGNDVSERLERWLVILKEVNVPVDVLEDVLTKLYRRDKVTKRIIAIAFLLDDQLNLRETKGIVKFGVFSFLPLKEVETNLNFIMHADFITEPGRATIASNALWNRWLRDETSKFIVNDVLNYFMKHETYKYQAPILILTEPESIRDPFIYELAKKVKDKLLYKEFIPRYDNNFTSPRRALLLPKLIYEVLEGDILELGKLIYDEYGQAIIHEKVLDYITSSNERLSYFIKVATRYDIKILKLCEIIKEKEYGLYRRIYEYIKNKQKDKLSFCKKVLHYLREYEINHIRSYSTYSKETLLKNLELLNLNGEIRALKDLYAIPLEKVHEYIKDKSPILKKLVDAYAPRNIVHQELLLPLKSLIEAMDYRYINGRNLAKEINGDEEAINYFIKSLESYVRDEAERLVSEIRKSVNAKNYDEVRKLTYQLLEYYELYPNVIEYIRDRMLLKVKGSDEFKTPDELFLPATLSESHRLESIIENIKSLGGPQTTLAGKLVNKIKFVDDEFYPITKENSGIWREFFKAFGVDNKMNDNKWLSDVAEAIGLEFAYLYELFQNREVHEVHGRPFDLEVRKPEWIWIEVKGSTRKEDELTEIELRSQQMTMIAFGKIPPGCNFYLYIVTDVLNKPTIIVVDSRKAGEYLRNVLEEKNVNIKVNAKELISKAITRRVIVEFKKFLEQAIEPQSPLH